MCIVSITDHLSKQQDAEVDFGYVELLLQAAILIKWTIHEKI